MYASRNDRLTGLLAGVLFVVFAAGSHYLVGMNEAGVWVNWLYLAQHVGINVVLGLVFGRSLIGPRQPLCTMFAGRVHEHMTPLIVRYTRQITVAWTVFFFAMAALSVLLFAFAPREAWSLFANILTLPLVAAMFVAENEVRKRVLPPQDQFGILAAVRAFRAAMRS